MEDAWRAYQRTLEREIGSELAEQFVGTLHAQAHGDEVRATKFFYDLGASWAPLMQAWSTWIAQNARGPIAIILRDAEPLCALEATTSWETLYLNRLTCGIPDELSGDSVHSQHPLLKEYMRQNGCADYFTFVDSGCYGTIVLALHTMGMRFLPLFFFSKNPHIRGFLNEIGISEEEGVILNDSLECGFPHIFARPSELTRWRKRVEPVLKTSDRLSARFGAAALCGLRDAHTAKGVSAYDAAQTVLRLSHKARLGECTGVLAYASPEWSLREEFLAQWPAHLCWS